MDAAVDFTGDKRRLELLREQALVAYLLERFVQDAIALRRDDANLGLHGGVGRPQGILHGMRLPKGQRAAAGSYRKGAGHQFPFLAWHASCMAPFRPFGQGTPCMHTRAWHGRCVPGGNASMPNR